MFLIVEDFKLGINFGLFVSILWYHLFVINQSDVFCQSQTRHILFGILIFD